MLRWLCLLSIALAPCATGPLRAEEPADPASSKFFETHIRPVLASKCVKCHGEKKQESGLRLDSLEALLAGGDSGPAIVPGKPAESLLVEAIRYESLEMPPTGKLADKEIAPFVQWIAANAPWPAAAGTIREGGLFISEADRDWWAFRPLTKPPVPQIAEDDWSKNEIDRFVFARLAEREMRPAPEAERLQLIRRLYYTVIGLPPSPEEIDAFLADDSPDAFEHVVDRLLADERYGEHWGRYWLDLVRYAESDGWNQDAYRPHIWRYRDYVVNSFNADKPYAQFVREQIAGDELPGEEPEHLTATGYLRLGIYEYNQRDARSHWDDIMNEIVDTTGDVFLGMGMACARCHDHKFDPLLQRDYFKLRAFFEPLIWRDEQVAATAEQHAEYQRQLAVWEEKTQAIREQIDALLKPYYDKKWKSTADKFPLDIQACFYKPVEERTSWDHQMAYLISRQFEEEGGGPLKGMKKEHEQQYEELKKQLAEFDEFKPKPLPQVMTAADFPGAISPTLIPDDPEQQPVLPGFLTVLSQVSATPNDQRPELKGTSGRRTELAEWIGRDDNPLTTRVIVNRIWQQHFGQGICPTPSDFGHLGQPPTHPELLDWLTTTFVAEGWRFKSLHKRILMSATWRQSATHPEAADYQQRDPGETLLWRARIRRLSAEQIRDAMFASSGELKQELGGPSSDGKSPRRSLYVKAIRNTPFEFLQLFDIANGLKSVAERNITTTPIQSLLMINGELTLGRAKKLSERLRKEKHETPDALLNRAFRLTWQREPSSDERGHARAYLSISDETKTSDLDAEKLTDLCHVLLNSNEFFYID